MPLCPWPQLIVFSFGAGSSLLITALIGGIAYNGKFGDDNKFRKYSYGWDQKFGTMCIANVSCAIFAIVFIMAAIFFNIKHFPKAVQIVFWVLADLAFIATIICEGLSIEWSKYGEFYVPSRNDYYNDKKFKEYVDTYYRSALNDEPQVSVTKFEGCDENKYAQCTPNVTYASKDLFNFEHMPYFFANFTYEQNGNQYNRTVPQCKVEWEKAYPSGIDPCNWVIEHAKCIGGWSAKNFKNYWCYAFRSNRSTSHKIRDESESEVERYLANKERAYQSVDSYNAFYEINNIFIGLQCSGFGLTTLSLLFLLCVNPFDKDKIHYKQIEASGSGSASVSKYKKKGGSSSGSSS